MLGIDSISYFPVQDIENNANTIDFTLFERFKKKGLQIYNNN